MSLLAAAACGTAERPALEGKLETRAQWLAPEVRASYFLIRPDERDCSPPRCGGYFVQSVNRASTPCPSAGRLLPECYVAALDLEPLQLVGSDQAALLQRLDSLLVRGMLSAVTIPGGLDFGRLRVLEVWQRQTGALPGGAFLRVHGESPEAGVTPLGPFTMATLNQPAAPVARVELDFQDATPEHWGPLVAQLSAETGLIITAEPAGMSVDAGAAPDAATAPDATTATDVGTAMDAGTATDATPAADAAAAAQESTFDPESRRLRVRTYYLPFRPVLTEDQAAPDDML